MELTDALKLCSIVTVNGDPDLSLAHLNGPFAIATDGTIQIDVEIESLERNAAVAAATTGRALAKLGEAKPTFNAGTISFRNRDELALSVPYSIPSLEPMLTAKIELGSMQSDELRRRLQIAAAHAASSGQWAAVFFLGGKLLATDGQRLCAIDCPGLDRVVLPGSIVSKLDALLRYYKEPVPVSIRRMASDAESEGGFQLVTPDFSVAIPPVDELSIPWESFFAPPTTATIPLERTVLEVLSTAGKSDALRIVQKDGILVIANEKTQAQLSAPALSTDEAILYVDAGIINDLAGWVDDDPLELQIFASASVTGVRCAKQFVFRPNAGESE